MKTVVLVSDGEVISIPLPWPFFVVATICLLVIFIASVVISKAEAAFQRLFGCGGEQ